MTEREAGRPSARPSGYGIYRSYAWLLRRRRGRGRGDGFARSGVQEGQARYITGPRKAVYMCHFVPSKGCAMIRLGNPSGMLSELRASVCSTLLGN